MEEKSSLEFLFAVFEVPKPFPICAFPTRTKGSAVLAGRNVKLKSTEDQKKSLKAFGRSQDFHPSQHYLIKTTSVSYMPYYDLRRVVRTSYSREYLGAVTQK